MSKRTWGRCWAVRATTIGVCTRRGVTPPAAATGRTEVDLRIKIRAPHQEAGMNFTDIAKKVGFSRCL